MIGVEGRRELQCLSGVAGYECLDLLFDLDFFCRLVHLQLEASRGRLFLLWFARLVLLSLLLFLLSLLLLLLPLGLRHAFGLGLGASGDCSLGVRLLLGSSVGLAAVHHAHVGIALVVEGCPGDSVGLEVCREAAQELTLIDSA